MHMNYRLMVETLLLESPRFNGEYWIQDDYVQMADSNIDLGHEAYAIQQAAYEVLSTIGIDADEPY